MDREIEQIAGSERQGPRETEREKRGWRRVLAGGEPKKRAEAGPLFSFFLFLDGLVSGFGCVVSSSPPAQTLG